MEQRGFRSPPTTETATDTMVNTVSAGPSPADVGTTSEAVSAWDRLRLHPGAPLPPPAAGGCRGWRSHRDRRGPPGRRPGAHVEPDGEDTVSRVRDRVRVRVRDRAGAVIVTVPVR